MSRPGDRLRDIVGGKTATALETAFDMHVLADLLAHYPRRYEERGQLTDLSGLQVGEDVTVLAEVASSAWVKFKSGQGYRFLVTIRDGGGSLDLAFFYRRRLPHLSRELAPGTRALFAGTVERFQRRLQLKSPAYQLLDTRGESEGAVDPELFAGALIPVYPAVAKLSSWQIATAVRVGLEVLEVDDDPLPAEIRARERLPGLLEALWSVHRPESRAEAVRARARLKWDEALALQTALARRRAETARAPARPRPVRAGGLLAAFESRLPYELTRGQRAVDAEITADLARAHPMHRLLAGEVGSGKTVVALRAMLAVVDTGGQAALLAPTEVLAQQHLRTLRDLLGSLGTAGELGAAEPATALALLTGSLAAAPRRAALAAAADGSAGIVVGTHALLSDGVAFADLGLVVVDEQHRFGVDQRAALRTRGSDGCAPHVLVMTATPIPRTVAMTVFGDLETSQLTELPGGRRPISTHVVDPRWVARMWEVVREQVAAGRQAFVVCPRIEAADDGPARGEDERPPAAAVLTVAPLLAETELAGLRVGLLHGRLPVEEKDAVMRGFADGRLDVLVSTTVVEVGVDVPNATVMVVLDADRFGVSQLHQLRGRIGRGSADSTCFLHTQLAAASPPVDRLRAVAATTDGAQLARLDLEVRGEGDVLGAAQSGGRSQVRLLRLLADEDLIAAARTEAQALVAVDPELAAHPALRTSVEALVADPSYLEKG